MKRSYQKQIEPESVVGMQSSRPVQIALPMAEVVSQLEQGLGELVRKVGHELDVHARLRRSLTSYPRRLGDGSLTGREI